MTHNTAHPITASQPQWIDSNEIKSVLIHSSIMVLMYNASYQYTQYLVKAPTISIRLLWQISLKQLINERSYMGPNFRGLSQIVSCIHPYSPMQFARSCANYWDGQTQNSFLQST